MRKGLNHPQHLGLTVCSLIHTPSSAIDYGHIATYRGVPLETKRLMTGRNPLDESVLVVSQAFN